MKTIIVNYTLFLGCMPKESLARIWALDQNIQIWDV